MIRYCRIKQWFPLLGLALLLSGCASAPPFKRTTLWRPSEKAAVVALDNWSSAPTVATFPAYDLRRHGDLGAGRLASGSGAALLDGNFSYLLGNDGVVYALTPSEALSEGWSVRFKPDRIDALPADFNHANLEALLRRRIGGEEVVCVLRIVGRFESIKLEGASGTGEGVVLRRVSGMLSGVKLPAGMEANEKRRLQVWFLSDNLLTGGKVADFRIIDGSLALDLSNELLIINPAVGNATRLLRQQD